MCSVHPCKNFWLISVAEEIARQIETVKREFNTADSDGELM